MKHEDDIVFWKTRGYKEVCNSFFRAVLMDPEFAVLNLYVSPNGVDAAITVPTQGTVTLMRWSLLCPCLSLFELF